jgi:serralysin
VSLGAGADVFVGTNFSDVAAGGAGMDVLYGLGGADTLIGGDGADWLQGGSDADWFSYDFLSESTVNAQDFIADFSSAEGDKINLNAALSNAGFATATFNTGYGTGASVYAFNQGSFSLVQVYTGATLQMQMVVSQASLAVTDFIL